MTPNQINHLRSKVSKSGVQVSKSKEHMELSAILGHASVSSLDKSKLDLDDSERMLDLCTDLRDRKSVV